MLFPYSLRTSPRARWALDAWTGQGWRLLERHELHVAAPPAASLDALAGLHLRELPAVRALFAARRLPFSPAMTLLEFFSTAPFVLLESAPGEELVGGILVRPRPAGGLRRAPGSPAEFRVALADAPFAAIASFRADPEGGGTRLATETLVRTRGVAPAALFGAYWLAIGPFSAWIRRMFLVAARARAEAAGPAARGRAVPR